MSGLCVYPDIAGSIQATGETAAQCSLSGHYWLALASDIAGRTYLADLSANDINAVLVQVALCLVSAYAVRVVIQVMRQ